MFYKCKKCDQSSIVIKPACFKCGSLDLEVPGIKDPRVSDLMMLSYQIQIISQQFTNDFIKTTLDNALFLMNKATAEAKDDQTANMSEIKKTRNFVSTLRHCTCLGDSHEH